MHGNGNGNIKQGRNSEMSMSTRCLRHPRKLLHAFIVGIASLILIATFKLALDFSRGNFSSVDKNVRSEKHTIVTSTENGRKSDLMQPRQINAQHHRWRNEKEFNMEVLRKAVERNAGPRKVDGDSLEGEGQNKKDFGEQNSLQQINDINSIIENSLPASHVTQSDTKYNGGETKSVGHRNESKLESAPVDIPQFARLTNNAPPCTPISPSEISFTLVTQASDERLWMLIEHCRRWAGPISLAVYTNNSTEDIRSYLETGCKTCNTTNLDSSVSQKKSSLGCIKRRDQLHIQTLPTLGTPDGDYPINHLRNMALRGVNTTHVVYVDVDFWPSDNLYSTLFHPDSRIRFEFSVYAHLAIVVPSFEYTPECHKSRQCQRHASHISQMPRTKREVLLLAKQKLVTVFDPTNPGGYSSTRYSEWAEMSQGELMDIPCFRSNRYEPFFVVRLCNDLPPYQEAFTGYGKNKISVSSWVCLFPGIIDICHW